MTLEKRLKLKIKLLKVLNRLMDIVGPFLIGMLLGAFHGNI